MFVSWKRKLLMLGIIGPALLILLSTIDAITRPEFNLIRHWISHQSLGERDWLGTFNLLFSGLLMCAFAIGLKQSLRTNKGSVWGPILIWTFGVGLLLVGLFPIDPGLGWPPVPECIRCGT